MDNFYVDVVSQERGDLEAALCIAFRNALRATHYRIDPDLGLVFLDCGQVGVTPEGAMAFPMPLKAKLTGDIAWEWLPTAHYGPRPDHDGDNNKGFRVSAGKGVGGDHHAFVAVKPQWIRIGR